ncbi:rod shape-determining protein MreC [Allosalinactinospora lopnorensis]|uniref:rod shape-determining protein MreC n=1 Tax=Allosalinactinospora lopnorensis TaxID=1352348 RepID=UPI000623F61C|nr:rod shape-determining protein MreC [Allosalinactinospora lopnorensis]
MRRGAPRQRLVLTVLLVVSCALVVLDSREDTAFVTDGARAAGEMVFTPVSAGVSAATSPVGDAYRALTAAPNARERIDELEERNRELTAELEARDLDEQRSAELEELLHLSGLGGYEIVPAQAVTRVDSQGFSDTITLDVGERDGIEPDMTVVNGDGLVGRVLRVGTKTATVLLLTDGASSVGARLEGASEMGIAHGTARSLDESSSIRFELLDADASVSSGERLVTMGSHGGTPFVPGVPVGTVKEVQDTPGALTRTAEVTPAVDIGSLNIVGVVVSEPERDPRDSVLPPKPDEDAAQAPRDDGAEDEE